MHAKLQEQWYGLPVLSGLLLILTFHPFDLWPLSFVALVPLYYFVAGFPERRLLQVFWGGFITGGIFAFSLSYFTTIQFHWLPEAYLFVTAVKLSVIPITLLSGALTGLLSAVVFRVLYSSSMLLNALLGAAVYTMAELLLQTLLGGYYFAFLAYAAVPLPYLMGIAVFGGASLVSFLIALLNALIVGALIEWPVRRRPYVRMLAGCAFALFVLAAGAAYYQALPREKLTTLSVAILQAASRGEVVFGKEEKGGFFAPALEADIRAAAEGGPDLIVYPFSPVEGALYRGARPPSFNTSVMAAGESSFARWLAPLAPSSTIMTWNTVYAEERFFNEFEFWRSGSVVSQYQKRKLFPFLDYTPRWAQRIGLYSTPYDITPGAGTNSASLNGFAVGSLMCSELHDASLARTEGMRSSLLLAVGSEAMFADDVASNFALRAAQYRAVENGMSVIRGNLLGPSAIIKPDGRLEAWLPAGQGGVVRGEVTLYAPRTTPYGRWGDLPLIAFICVILGAALWKRHLRLPAKASR